MRYLLDTNVLISLLRNGNSPVASKILSVGIDSCCIADVTLYELYCGAAYSRFPERETGRIDLLRSQIAVLDTKSFTKEAARQKAFLKERGTLIEDFDILIGAAAIANGCTLVTSNVKHLSRLSGLKIEDWGLQSGLEP